MMDKRPFALARRITFSARAALAALSFLAAPAVLAVLAVLPVAWVAPGPCRAEAAEPAVVTPTGGQVKPRTIDAILADNVAALGGRKAMSRPKSIRIKSEVTVKGMGLSGTEDRHATSAGKLLSVMTVPGIGSFRQGSTGKVRWSEDPINGLRLLEGAEAEQARLESTWNAELHIKQLYKQVKLAPVPADAEAQKDRPEQRLECLELVPRLGSSQVACFDTTTHLRVFQKGTHATPQGEVPFVARFSDFRDVGFGLKAPFRQEAVAGPMTIQAQVQSVELDVKVPNSLFELPKGGK